MVSLGGIAEIVSGATPASQTSDYWGGDVPWVTPADLSNLRDAYIASTPRNLTQSGLASCAAKLLPAGSVLLSSRAPIGHVAINSVPMATNQGFKSFVPRREKVDAKYLYHWILASRELLQSLGNGATFKELSRSTVERIEIPLPPLDEQRRIAAILDQADGIRSKQREVLGILQTLDKSVFLEMFGDPVRNERDHRTISLDELGKLERGVSRHRPRNDPRLLDGPYPLIQTGDVAASGGQITKFRATYSELGLKQSRLWPPGTLCITIAANIAKTGILTFEACFPDSVVGFTGRQETVKFVQVWLSFLQSALESSAPQSAQKNINLQVLRGLRIIDVGSESRRMFAERVTHLNDQIQNAEALIAGADHLFASLQSRAFRGEL